LIIFKNIVAHFSIQSFGMKNAEILKIGKPWIFHEKSSQDDVWESTMLRRMQDKVVMVQ